jgi:beta-lactam-binding protein with PASTA domain
MARYFQITAPEGMSNPKLDSQGCATLQLKAKNVTGAALDGRAILISLPVVSPAAGAVQNGWVKIDGPAEQHFEKDQEKVFVVKIAVPKKNAKPGNYQFRMDVVSVAVTDQGDSSQVFAFTVAEVKKVESHFPMWLIPVLAILVIGIGVGLYFLLHKGNTASNELTVPDLQGKTVTEATTILTDAKLTMDPTVETIQSKPEDADKVVSQIPTAGTKANSGDAVHVKMGAEMVTVPTVTPLSFDTAQGMLIARHLTLGSVTKQPNANVAGGIVFRQSPDPGSSVLTGSSIQLWVTPKTIAVPSVINMKAADAWKIIQDAGLVPVLQGNQTARPVIAQSPAAQTQVEVGSTVDVSVPSSPFCVPPRCRFAGNLGRLMVARK